MKRLSIIFVLFLLIPVADGFAGVPVVDVPAIERDLRNYLLALKKFESLAKGTYFSAEKYYLMVKDYYMKLQQFKSFLQEIQSVEHMIDKKDWYRLALTAKNYYGQHRGMILTALNIESKGYEKKRDALLSEYHHVPRNPNDVQRDARSLGMNSQSFEREAERDFKRYNDYKDKMDMVSHNASKIDEQKKDIENSAKVVKKLGPSSNLATMQTIAAQNILLMKQLAQIAQIQNQQLLYQQMDGADRAAKRAQLRDEEIKRLQNRLPTQPLGRDRWGNL